MENSLKIFRVKYLPLLKNKFVLVFLGFIIWLSFFDRNDLLTTWSYRKKLNQLRAEKSYYEQQIQKDKIYLNELMTNRNNLEKYARERYLMKRDNEEIFYFFDPSKAAEAQLTD